MSNYSAPQYLTTLADKIESLLPENSYFSLEDGSQSFVICPTNHVELRNDFISIEVGTVIYANIKEHEAILERIRELYSLLTDFSDTIEDHTSINPLEGDTVRLNWGGVYIDQDSKDFGSVNDLINYLKINK